MCRGVERLCCKNAGVVVSSASIQQHQRSSLYESAESVQIASLRSRDHSPMRALVPAVCTQLPRSGGNDARTRTAGGSHDDLSLGSTVRPRTRETVPPSSESLQRFLESG